MINLSTLPPPALIFIVGLISLCVGSFLNVVISRTPKILNSIWKKDCYEFLGLEDKSLCHDEPFSLLYPSSHCFKCSEKVLWTDNIPIISFILLKGRCRNCSNRIPTRYILVEIITTLLSCLVAYHIGIHSNALIPALILTWSLIVITFIDLENLIIPDNINYPILWLGLIVNSYNIFTNLHDALWGAIGGYLILWFIYQIFKLITKKEGMGFGDFKLLALLGAWLGWQMLPAIIFMASLFGSIVGILYINFSKKGSENRLIPFGPFLSSAGIISLLWGNDLNNLYLNTFVNI